MKTPTFSVIIPMRAISSVLTEENLPALDKQTNTDFEVIVLPNKSSKYDGELLKKYSWLKIIPTNPITRPAQKRDIGAKKARGKILAFIDDDAYPTKNWLSEADKLMNETSVEAICGPGILPKNAAFLEHVFDEVLKTWVGSGGLAYRFIPQKKRFIDDYPSMNFLIQKKVFEKLGGFDNNYWPGEDSKLCEDLVYKLHGKILYHPRVVIYHHRRADLAGYLKQHGQYGYHRGAFFAHGDKNSRRLFYLAPTVFVGYLLSIIYYVLRGGLTFVFFIPLLLYLGLLTYQSFSSFKNTRNLIMAIFSSIVLFLMHTVYGVKFVQGFLIGLIKKDRIY